MRPIPHHCVLCLGLTRRPLVCSTCRHQCIARPLRISAFENTQPWEIRALGSFDGALRRLVLKLKHGRDGPVGEWLGQALAPELSGLDRPDAITWVPSQLWNRWRRGGDPTYHLALGIGQSLSIPVQSTLQPTLSWHGRNRAKSQRELGRFRANSSPHGRLWLVDDVFVTGSTMAGASHALEQAGYAVTQHCAVCLG